MELFEVVFWVVALPNSLLMLILAIIRVTKKDYAVTYEYRGKEGKIYKEIALIETMLLQKVEKKANKQLPIKIKMFEPDFSGFEIVEIRKIEVL